jgi:hypothetical protein
MLTKLSLQDGKYTWVYNDHTATLICLRDGQPWRGREFIGDNAVHALFHAAVDAAKAAGPEALSAQGRELIEEIE